MIRTNFVDSVGTGRCCYDNPGANCDDKVGIVTTLIFK